MTRPFRIGAGAWAYAGMLVLLLLIAFRREPDLSDESYYVYEAWSAWGVADFQRPSSPLAKQFGHVLGIPALWRDVPSLLDLRLFGLGLWLLSYASLAWALARRWKLPHGGAWTLLLLPHTIFLATPGYQNLPAIFLALAFAAWLRARDDSGPLWSFLAGGLLGALPFAHPPHLPLVFPLALAMLWPLRWKSRLLFCLGGYVMLGGFHELWTGTVSLWAAEQQLDLRWLADKPLDWTAADPERRAIGMAGSLFGLRWQKGLRLCLWVAGLLGAGFALRRSLSGAAVGTLIPPRIRQGLIVLAGLGFLVLWTLGVRRNATLMGLLTWALVLALPALAVRLRQKQIPYRELGLLAACAFVFGLAQAWTGGVRTESFYFMAYSPLVWIPAGLLAERCMERGTARAFFATLVVLNLWIALTHNHRGASILQGRRVAFDHPAYRGLGMSPARRDLLENIREELVKLPAGTKIYGLDQSPFVYLLAGREVPFRQPFLIDVPAAWARRMQRESPRGAWLLFRDDGREIRERLLLPPDAETRVTDFGEGSGGWQALWWQPAASTQTARPPPR